MTDTAGKVEMARGFVFFWMIDNSGEIYGFVQDNAGKTVDGSSGWWRTDSPERASKCAAALYCAPEQIAALPVAHAD